MDKSNPNAFQELIGFSRRKTIRERYSEALIKHRVRPKPNTFSKPWKFLRQFVLLVSIYSFFDFKTIISSKIVL